MRWPLIFLGLLAILALSQCTKKVNCDESDNKRLGSITYSDSFKAMNKEADTRVITFFHGSDTVTLENIPIAQEEQWLIDHKICESIDIKPYFAYAYYAYPGYTRVFSSGDMLLSINAEIQEENKERFELLYFNWSEWNRGYKCVLPVGKADYMPEEESVKTMQYHSKMVLGGKEYSDVWGYEELGNGIYYQAASGVVAIKRNDSIFNRVK